MGWLRRPLAIGLAAAILGFGLGRGIPLAAALLTDTESNPATFTTAANFDVMPPTIPSSVISKTVPYLPGYVRQGGTYYVYANASDAGGLASVRADVSTLTAGQTSVALVAGAYTAGGVAYTYRSASLTADAVITAGVKAYTVAATDNASNVTTVGFTVTVDNTAPTGTDVQTANGSTTAGKPELGDTLTLTFSEVIDPESIQAAWTGSSTSVVVRITNGFLGLAPDVLTIRNAANSAQLPLGDIDLIGTGYVTATRDFGASGTASSMVASGNSIIIMLGTPSAGTGTQGGAGLNMSWTPSATATDRAGNACLTTPVTESGALDLEF
jgi:hypothetical protein